MIKHDETICSWHLLRRSSLYWGFGPEVSDFARARAGGISRWWVGVWGAGGCEGLGGWGLWPGNEMRNSGLSLVGWTLLFQKIEHIISSECGDARTDRSRRAVNDKLSDCAENKWYEYQGYPISVFGLVLDSIEAKFWK